jgi:GTPase Era involved in 16S rRNA processing
MSFKKDALLHKLQDENEKYKLAHRACISEISLLMKENKKLKNNIKDALYKFIDYYTQDELENLDMRFVADKFLEEEVEE